MTEYMGVRQHAVNPERPTCEAFAEIIDRVGKLAAVIEAIGNGLARPSGQTLARWQVLAAVDTVPASVSAIANELGHTRQSVQRIADLLVGDGLAAYRPNPAHQRAKLLEVTPEGLTALHRMRALFDQLAERTSEGLELERLASARDILDVLHQRLQAELPNLPGS
ncbi:MarR family winged helix-turn-helix transcriptional regulator [Mycolicibacterium goodii]|uniref:MarR family winged helix-turn-helix transcriptional regulator n=1 Tax=Mycolicibacterium goodii TaxID=134601 RepID=UPI0009F8FF61